MLQPWSFDAVVLCTDRVVPSTLRYLRDSARLPILLLTPSLDETSHVCALELGASYLLPLPGSTRPIATKLREAGVTRLRLDTIHGRGYCLSLDPSGFAPEPQDDDANEDDCAAA
jgi:hypothetical protein